MKLKNDIKITSKISSKFVIGDVTLQMPIAVVFPKKAFPTHGALVVLNLEVNGCYVTLYARVMSKNSVADGTLFGWI